jgi:hypothetical protein
MGCDTSSERAELVWEGPEAELAALAVGGEVIKCPSPLNVLKYTYDISSY